MFSFKNSVVLAALLGASVQASAVVLLPAPAFTIDPVNVDLDAPDLECSEIQDALQKFKTMSIGANEQAQQFFTMTAGQMHAWYSELGTVDGRQCKALGEDGFEIVELFSTRTAEVVFWSSELLKARIEQLDIWNDNLPACLDSGNPGHGAACEDADTARFAYFDLILADDSALVYHFEDLRNRLEQQISVFTSYECSDVQPDTLQPMADFSAQLSDAGGLVSENLSNLSVEYDRISRSLDNCL